MHSFYLSDSSYTREINHKARFVDASEYHIKTPEMFLGFLCGMLSSNYDIGTIFIDAFLKLIKIDIAEADVIVAVGRGACSAGMLEQAKELADLLGGVVACTRPLVEGNVFDAKRQIGLSGRTVKPKLIITLGISGAVQFAAGMKSSDCIVAVNTDSAAPIFDIAHYCVVGDVNLIVPKLIAKIKGVS